MNIRATLEQRSAGGPRRAITTPLGEILIRRQAPEPAPLADAFRVHAPGRSFPAARPIARLDRIALSEGWHLGDAGVHVSPLARLASDHLPVWADVRLSPDD